ncbi:uncharacterized protein METZ01_LOCUS457265, partial [marine metagenome]
VTPYPDYKQAAIGRESASHGLFMSLLCPITCNFNVAGPPSIAVRDPLNAAPAFMENNDGF